MSVKFDITVAIPAHPARLENGLLSRAVFSVFRQEHSAAGLSIAVDLDKQGAPATRQRALDGVTTGWTAFLDSDDEFLPQHLRRLAQTAQEQEADYVFSWFQSPCGFDPFPLNFGHPFDPLNPVETTITILVRTELAKEARFTEPPDGWHWLNTGEDRRFTLRCIELGAKIVHLAERTWVWHNEGPHNTSGLPTKGDAV